MMLQHQLEVVLVSYYYILDMHVTNCLVLEVQNSNKIYSIIVSLRNTTYD